MRTLWKVVLFLVVVGIGQIATAARIQPVGANASNSYPGNGPSLAIDSNISTFWSSGAFPTPTSQWIQLDLGTQKRLSVIRLLTSQTPAGITRHEIYGRDSAGNWIVDFGGFNQSTADSQWLELSISSSAEVRYIYVETTQSPSWVGWREIEVYEYEAVPPLTWYEAWTSNPCIYAASDGDTPFAASKYYSVSCPGNKFWISPLAVEGVYKSCDIDPDAFNCTKVSGGILEIHGGDEYGGPTASAEGMTLSSDTSFGANARITATTLLKPICTYIEPGTWDGCFVGLTLYDGERDYRAVGIWQTRDGLRVQRLMGDQTGEVALEAGFVQSNGTLAPGINPTPPNTYFELKIEYQGDTPSGLTNYYFNGVLFHSESIAKFVARPRISLAVASTGTSASGSHPRQYNKVLVQPVTTSYSN